MTYFAELKKAIYDLHGCHAKHIITTPVKEVFEGNVAWAGDVEVFGIAGHPRAIRCYAWGYPADDNALEREITTVLEIPPIVSAETAVKAAISAAAKNVP
jgi:hypothetical protein